MKSAYQRLSEEKNVNLEQAFAVFANETKFELRRRFIRDEGAFAKIDEAFATAKSNWQGSLAAAFGEEDADALMRQMDIEITSQSGLAAY
jgi:hypothetical protein